MSVDPRAASPLDGIGLIERDGLGERLDGASDRPTVLCASPRLAQQLQADYAQAQAARGRRVWDTPPIRSLEALLTDRASEAFAKGVGRDVLSTGECVLLWRLVVAEAREDFTLLREGEAARLAADAWRLCVEYDVSLPLQAGSPEVEAFNRWAQAYRARCRRLDRDDPHEWRLRQIDTLGQTLTGRTIVLAGFDPEPPWLRRLVASLQDGGSTVLRLADGGSERPAQGYCASSPEQELLAAAHWTRERALAQPGSRIGIVVPDLGARRADLMRIFDQVLCPSLDDLASSSASRPYNLSLGQPLSDTGLVRCALQLLQTGIGGLDLPAAGSLLCSPYWGDDDSRMSRANSDRLLREQGHLRIDLPTLQALGGDARIARLPPLASQRRADPAQWAERFTEWLDLAGWPGARPLDSADFQTLEAWRDLLASFGALGDVLGPVPASAALAQLSRLAGERVFQPQSPPVNIQVLGVSEAAGLSFDALRVLGLDDEHWPPAGRPNPFIPFELQRRLGMPHASTAQELAWAERSTQAWRRAAPEVVFCWPATDGDRPLLPSPLIQAEADGAQTGTPAQPADHWREARALAQFETFADHYAPHPDLARAVPGGTRLIGDQATCPFRAFATHRLGAKALEQPGYGPNAIDRGVVTHRVLETLWRQWRDHATLASLDDAALDRALGAAVDTELQRMATRAPQRFAPTLVRLEAERLGTLLRQWLTLERERPPFTVERLEGRMEADTATTADDDLRRFGPLQLRLRPDRIDRLDDGRRLVIDYKTGVGRKPPWRDARPEEPQLLLYALTESGIDGIAYARLRAGTVGLDGIGADADLAPQIRAYTDERDTRDASGWDALMGRWRGELQTLADEIARGLASVTPKHPRQSCRDCSLHALCRIRELAPEAADDEAAT